MSPTSPLRRGGAVLLLLVSLVVSGAVPVEAPAQVSQVFPVAPVAHVSPVAQRAAAVHVVGNDRGGRLKVRLDEIQKLRGQGVRVEIRGAVCLSSCTLYLGAGDVCVASDTRFGFHGPYYRSRPISAERFEYWSRRMAEHYPPPLRDWFLTEARYVSNGYLSLSGAELIRLGVARC